MRSPSERLIQTLTTSGLCTRSELDSCEPIVRQLCHDLPDFDSVWLDALVQQRFLTPWQAEQIQEDRAEKISVGRYQCQRPLGLATFLARDAQRHAAVVLRSLAMEDPGQRCVIDRRLEELIPALDRSRKSAPACLVLPTEIVVRAGQDSAGGDAKKRLSESFVVAPCISGWSLEELLIRGGRLPSPVVAEIGRELLTALTWLESVRLLHGDLVTRNVRLDTRGGVYLTSPFVRRLLQPQFALTDQLTLRDCEGIAPEQVGTGRTADARSELYALGCLLWQLLTSRPVVLTADPVSRLMKQKEQDITDVRGPVPDCPEWMSRLILAMTRRFPELRPATAAEVLKQWRSHSGGSLSQCRMLARSMPDHSMRAKPRTVSRTSRRATSWIWPATATAVLGTLVFLTARSGVLPKTLRLGTSAELTESFAPRKTALNSDSLTVKPVQTGPLPLPEVDADGLIRLTGGTSYLAEPRAFAGSLRIVCDQSPVAKVLVREDSRWQLRARSIELRGISLEQQALASPSEKTSVVMPKLSRQLVELQCASLAVSDCVIQSPAQSDEFEGIAWLRPPREEGVVIVRNTVFAGGGYGLSFNHPPRRCELENVLLANRVSGMLCEFQKGDADTWEISYRNVTQRFGFSVCDTVVHDGSLKDLNIDATSTECVYAPQMAIFRLRVPGSWTPDSMQVQLRAGETGNPAVVPPTTQPAIYIDQRLKQAVSLPESRVTDNSLLLADLIFDDAGSGESETTAVVRSEWSASALLDFEGPKLTPLMPGVDVSRLPKTR